MFVWRMFLSPIFSNKFSGYGPGFRRVVKYSHDVRNFFNSTNMNKPLLIATVHAGVLNGMFATVDGQSDGDWRFPVGNRTFIESLSLENL